MSLAAALLNLVLGLVYCSYGVMTIIDLRRAWATVDNATRHFGFAWVAMAFTCGPHHVEHGVHLLSGQPGQPIDTAAVLVGLPFGITWFLLRVEVLYLRRGGDRVIVATPRWVKVSTWLTGLWFVAVPSWLFVLAVRDRLLFRSSLTVWLNAALVVIYLAIGYRLLSTQLRHRRAEGAWSLSGLALTGVFPTCAVMHGVWAFLASAGFYEPEWHLLLIDTVAVPAGLYFLWAVNRSEQEAPP